MKKRKKRQRIASIILVALLIISMVVPVIANASEVGPESEDPEAGIEAYSGDETYVDPTGTETKVPPDESHSDNPFSGNSKKTEEYSTWEVNAIVDYANVEITVEENNIYHVKKDIHLYYNTNENKYLVMEIPLNSFVKSSKDEITNLNLATDATMTGFDSKSENGKTTMTITDGSVGKQFVDYSITYDYVSRGDEDHSSDIMSQELLGFVGVPVCDMDFKIHMPKEYEQKDLYFTDSAGNKITISQSKEGLDVIGYKDTRTDDGHIRINLAVQNKYFKSTKASGLVQFLIGVLSFICGLLVAFGFGLAGISYNNYGKSEKPEIIQQRKPVNGLSPIDNAIVMSGSLTNENIMLYLLYLANKGYIGIQSSLGKYQKNRNAGTGYWFVRTKDYDGSDRNLKDFMNIIFGKNDVIQPKDLSGKIYAKINDLRIRILESSNGFWESNEFQKRLCASVGIIVPAITCMVISMYNMSAGMSGGKILASIYGILMTAVIAVGIKFLSDFIKKKDIVRGGVADTMTWIYIGGVATFAIVVLGIVNSKLFVKHSMLLTFAYLSEIALIFCSEHMKRRTERGTVACGKILGFRNYLSELNSMDMRRIIVKDVDYPYKALPYAIALDVTTDGWLAEMDRCIVINPKWYQSEMETEFSIDDFVHDWANMISIMLEKPEESM